MPIIKKLNSRGFSHSLLVPIMVIAIIATIGSYIITRSKAATSYTNGAIFVSGTFLNQDGSNPHDAEYPHGTSDLNFSQDGSKIAYSVQKYANNKRITDIFVASSDGKNEKKLVSDIRSSGKYSWSPDGKWLVFTAGDSELFDDYIGLVRTDGSEYHILPTAKEGQGRGSISNPVFNHTSDKIIFVGQRNELCTMNLDGNELACAVISFGDNYSPWITNIALSPDNDSVLITRIMMDYGSDCQSNLGCDATNNLYLSNLAGQNVRKITHNEMAAPSATWINDAVWAPNGNKIVYGLSGYADQRLTGLYLLNADGTDEKKISDLTGTLSWQGIPAGGNQSPLSYRDAKVVCEVTPFTDRLVAGATVSHTVTFTNNSPGPVTLASLNLVETHGSNTVLAQTNPAPSITIPAGQTQTIDLPSFMVPYAQNSQDSLMTFVNDSSGIVGCMSETMLPIPNITINGPLERSVPYKGSVTFTGTTTPNTTVQLSKSGVQIGSTTTSSANGLFSLTHTFTENATINVKLTNHTVSSQNIVIRVAPAVTGPTNRSVKRNKTIQINGAFKPHANLVVSMRKPGDPAGKYPRKINVKTGANGEYSFTFTADTKKAFYITAPNGSSSPVYSITTR